MIAPDDNNDLYDPRILAYAQDNSLFREHCESAHLIKAYNPLCGDKFKVCFDAGDLITNTSFFGYGCMVSKASTALLSAMIIDLDPAHVRKTVERFISAIKSGDDVPGIDARLIPFLAVRKYPGRQSCVLLAWEALLQHPLFREP